MYASLTADMDSSVVSVRVRVSTCGARTEVLYVHFNRVVVKASNVIEFDLVLNFAFYFKTRFVRATLLSLLLVLLVLLLPWPHYYNNSNRYYVHIIHFFSSAPKLICIWNNEIDTEWEKESERSSTFLFFMIASIGSKWTKECMRNRIFAYIFSNDYCQLCKSTWYCTKCDSTTSALFLAIESRTQFRHLYRLRSNIEYWITNASSNASNVDFVLTKISPIFPNCFPISNFCSIV